jgi:hypothetical protein
VSGGKWLKVRSEAREREDNLNMLHKALAHSQESRDLCRQLGVDERVSVELCGQIVHSTLAPWKVRQTRTSDTGVREFNMCMKDSYELNGVSMAQGRGCVVPDGNIEELTCAVQDWAFDTKAVTMQRFAALVRSLVLVCPAIQTREAIDDLYRRCQGIAGSDHHKGFTRRVCANVTHPEQEFRRLLAALTDTPYSAGYSQQQLQAVGLLIGSLFYATLPPYGAFRQPMDGMKIINGDLWMNYPVIRDGEEPVWSEYMISVEPQEAEGVVLEPFHPYLHIIDHHWANPWQGVLTIRSANAIYSVRA